MLLLLAGACRLATIIILIATSSLVVNSHRDLIVARAARQTGGYWAALLIGSVARLLPRQRVPRTWIVAGARAEVSDSAAI